MKPGTVPEELATSAFLKPLVDAHLEGRQIAFFPTTVKIGGFVEVWRVACFADGIFLLDWGGGPSLEIMREAERMASYFPGSLLIGHVMPAAKIALRPMQASDLASRERKPREFNVPGMIPSGVPTLLYGDGGTGKSSIALQLGFASVTGTPWFKWPVKQGPVLFLTAEDDVDDLQERIERMADHAFIPIEALEDLHIVSLAGDEAILGQLDHESGTIVATPLYEMLEDRIEDIAPVLVVLDTLADLFGGDENIRGQARQFITLMRRLARPSNAAILVLAHPSVAGINSGMGTSGSTGWSNSVRSRLYLSRVYTAGRDGKPYEPDRDARILANHKLNYGPSGSGTNLRCIDGHYVVDDQLALPPPADPTADSNADTKFLDLLAIYETDGRKVSSTPSGTFAPVLFAKDSRAEGMTKQVLAKAMQRLLERKAVVIEEYGPPSKRRTRLALPSEVVP